MSQIRMLRNSERSTLKRCPTRWYWGYELGLKPNTVKTALWMGTGVHEALAEWYQPGFKRGKHPVETWNEYCEDEESKRMSSVWEDEEIAWYDAKDMGRYMLTSYVEFYGKDKKWKVIATEQTFQVLISDKETKLKAYLVGTFDGVYRDMETGELWLMEHKTAKAISILHLPMDPQASTYHYAATRVLRKAGLIGPKERIVGVMYNFLLKYNPPADDRPMNEDGFYTNKPVKQHYIDAFDVHGIEMPAKNQTLVTLSEIAEENGVTVYGDVSKVQPKAISEMFHREPVKKTIAERANVGRQITEDALVRQKLIDGEIPLMKNPTKDCSWDCDFYRMCQMHQAGEDWEEYRDLVMHQIDPYEDHGKKSS